MSRKHGVRVTLPGSRRMVDSWTNEIAADLADQAQAGYLHALAFADEVLEHSVAKSRRWPKAKRARELAAAREMGRERVAKARRRANDPLRLANERVTGRDADVIALLANAALTKTGRTSARTGVYCREIAYYGDIGTADYAYDNNSGAIALGLYDRQGMRAGVIVRGGDTELLAQLLTVLRRADAKGGR